MSKRTINIIQLTIVLLLATGFQSGAQKVSIVPDRNRIFIGEQIKVKLSVEQVPMGTPWLNVQDTFNHLEVVERGKVDTVNSNGAFNFYQTISITSFDSGSWKFPSLIWPGINVVTSPFNLDVLPVDVSQMKDYNDIRDIIEYKKEFNWLLFLLVAVGILLLALLARWYVKKRKNSPAIKKVNDQSPLDWALEELEKLHGQPYTTTDGKKYYGALTDISRTFFARQFAHRTATQTTDEWMIALQALQIDADTRSYFFQVLRLSDAVKFAKYMPPTVEIDASMNHTRQMIKKAALLHSEAYSKFQPK